MRIGTRMKMRNSKMRRIEKNINGEQEQMETEQKTK